MATIEGYGSRFIGNDMVRPQARRPVVNDMITQRPARPTQSVARVHIQQYAPRPQYKRQSEIQTPTPVVSRTPEQPAPVESYAEPEPVAPFQKKRRFSGLFTKKRGIITAVAVVVIAGSIVALPHLSAPMQTTRAVANRIALGASVDLHHSKSVSFVMPQNSILVRSNQLSSFTDAIEGQNITISVGNTTVTPKPLDIQNWFFTTAGPQSNSTIIEASTSNISAYLTSLAQKNDPNASSDAVATATSQLAQALVKSNGATISIQ